MARTTSTETRQAPARVTQADVARRAGVSVSVVSRELSGDPVLRARPDTRRRIRQAAEELGYRPSHAARSLRLSRAFAVGVVIPDLTSPLYDPLIRGIEDAADELGYHVLISRTERLEPRAGSLRELAGEGRVDGFIVQPRDEVALRDLAPLTDAGDQPVVVVNARSPRRSSVVHDDEAAGRIATGHLLDLGHRDVALIGGDALSHTARARERGYVAAIHAAGMRRRSSWVLHRRYEPEEGRSAVRELCTMGRRRPTAIVVANLNAAVGVLRGAMEIGLRIPEQLSVVAIHDWWVTDFTRPRLTTVHMPQYELGLTAMRLLALRLAGEPAGEVVLADPPPRLVERESTGPPPRRLARARLPERD